MTQAGMRTLKEENQVLKARVKELSTALEEKINQVDKEVQDINQGLVSSPSASRKDLYHDRSQSQISIAESNRFEALHSIIKEKAKEVS